MQAFQFCDLWAQSGAFLADQCGRSLRAKELGFPSMTRRAAYPDLFRPSLRTLCATIKAHDDGLLRSIGVIV